MKRPTAPATDCPCNDRNPYEHCCKPLHDGLPAASAEALMRSRYSAYVLGLEPYLLQTWHSSTRPASLDLAADDPKPRWLGLKLLRHESTGADTAQVEFVARYRVGGGSAQKLQERSRFLREQGRWYYLDGSSPEPPARG